MNGEESRMEQDEIKIGTWNARSSMGKEEELEEEMISQDIEIL